MQPTASIDTDYYTRLGLECDPFARAALPDFFFVGAQRRFLVQRAVHALYFSGATVLLLGADGAGKTRTLDEIAKELKDLVDICRIEATVLMDAAEIRGLLAGALGLPGAVAASNADLVRALELMRPADGDPQPVLLVVDAAHLLSTSTLAECSALVASAGGRLRLLFAGEVNLATAWQQAQAGAAEILELAALDRNETEDYVRTKLQAAGYRAEQPLSDAEFDLLFAQSGGNFAAINTFAPPLLARPVESSVVSSRIKALPVVHIGVIAALLAGVILLLLYRGGGHSQSDKEVPLPSAARQTPPALASKTNSEQSTVALQLPETVAPPTPVVAPTPAQQTETPSSAAVASTANPKTKIEKPIAAKLPAKSAREKAQPTVSNTNISVSTLSASLDADERSLLEFPPTHYVLQLMGAESKTTVDKYANGPGKGLKLYCYRTELRGKPWLVVVTGPYPDKAVALAALARLPAAARRGKPWPRSVVNVQADISAHRGGR